MEGRFVASWRPDAAKFYKADAQKVAEEVYTLGDKPETEDILEMARDETKETHKIIEWDDTKAANSYRLYQVRSFLHDLQIVEFKVDETKKKTFQVPIRMFHNLKGETGYRSIPQIAEVETLNEKLLKTARLDLVAFYEKYRILDELAPVFEAIRKYLSDNPPDAA